MKIMRRDVDIALSVDTSNLRPGLRLAVGLSGGADSVALLRALAEQGGGLVLSAAHLHHGLRGAEADADQQFARELAEKMGVPFFTKRVDVAAAAKASSGKAAESIEEAARRVRYGWFRQLMADGEMDAVATAHTMDDQAETVLLKFLRGSWTEGLSGVHPVVEFPEGRIVRPFLTVRRTEIEAYLKSLGQPWREDSTNQEMEFARNRVRHELLPTLEDWNPRMRENLVRMAELARDEESYWKAQLTWLAPQLLLPGDPVRGGGRAAGNGVALDVCNLVKQPAALQRRLLRYAAEQLGAGLDFYTTEALRELALHGRSGQRRELAQGIVAERSHRELRLRLSEGKAQTEVKEFSTLVPGEVSGYGFRLKVEAASDSAAPQRRAILRPWKAGDRVRPRYTSGPRKVKEVLERMKVSGDDRALWPVLEVDGKILWMKNVDVEPETDLRITIFPAEE